MTSNNQTDSIPLVSVIIPFLNGIRFMDEAVGSVTSQNYPSWEILLVDDASTDGSTQHAKRFAAAHPDRIFYLEHEGRANRGPGLTRNLGLRHARGKYVAFLDVDDFWLPEKLERQVEHLEAHPDAAMTYGPYFIWFSWTGKAEDANRDLRGDVCPAEEYEQVIPPPRMLLKHIRQEIGLPVPSCAMIRRDVLEKLGGFEAEFTGMYDDEALFTKITLSYPVFVTSGCWDRYRQHPGSFCARAIQSGEWDPDPQKPSRDRVRLIRWQKAYIASHAPGRFPELAEAIRQKAARFSI